MDYLCGYYLYDLFMVWYKSTSSYFDAFFVFDRICRSGHLRCYEKEVFKEVYKYRQPDIDA